VIVPFLDSARFLAEAIASVRTQSYARWELLLIDAGSTDGSTEIARRHAAAAPERIRYLEHAGHENRGRSASRNLGLANARGSLVAFLDSDDVWHPRKLGRQVALLDAHPDAALVYGRSEYWHSWNPEAPEGERDRIPRHGIHVPIGTVIRPPALAIVNYPLGLAPAPPPSDVMVRRDVLEYVGGFDESFHGPHAMYEDQAFFSKLYLRFGVYVSDECWDRYRVRPDSCVAAATRQGHYHSARRFFLRWLEGYLLRQQIADPEVWQALEMASWPYGGWADRAALAPPVLDAAPTVPGGGPEPAYEGFHDQSDCDVIAGWARDARRPDVPIAVDLYADDRLLATVRANRFRKDLADADKGRGYHAFSIPCPPWLKDGRRHLVRARVASTGVDLGRTPHVVVCEEAGGTERRRAARV